MGMYLNSLICLHGPILSQALRQIYHNLVNVNMESVIGINDLKRLAYYKKFRLLCILMVV